MADRVEAARRASATLRDRHRDEYEAILAETLERMNRPCDGQRTIDDELAS